MNSARRLQIKNIMSKLNDIKSQLDALKEAVTDIQAEEEEYRDNMPENLQESDRYCKADEACDKIEDANNNFDNIDEEIEAALDSLEESMA